MRRTQPSFARRRASARARIAAALPVLALLALLAPVPSHQQEFVFNGPSVGDPTSPAPPSRAPSPPRSTATLEQSSGAIDAIDSDWMMNDPPPGAGGDGSNASGRADLSVGFQSQLFRTLCSGGGGGNGVVSSDAFFCESAKPEDLDETLSSPPKAEFGVVKDVNGTLLSQFPPNPELEGKCAPDEIGKFIPPGAVCSADGLVFFTTNTYAMQERGLRAKETADAEGPAGRIPKPSKEIQYSWVDKLLQNQVDAVAKSSPQGDAPLSIGSTDFDQLTVSLARQECSMRCNNGYQCMIDIDNAPMLATRGQGTCQPCDAGTYCPAGSINDNGLLFTNAKVNLCPPGYFCPNATVAYNCPAGHFCPAATITPYRCDNFVVAGAELRGNYCPENSADPWGICPKKYYCPTSEQAIRCPEGYYCPVQSIKPLPCPQMSQCPEGSDIPRISSFSWITILCIIGGMGIALGGLYLSIRINQRRVLAKARDAEMQAQLLKAIGVKLGLSSEQMSYATELSGFSDKVMCVDIIVKDLCINMVSRLKANRLVLNGVNVNIKSSTLNVILGSSGAGKTTFLKALVGRFSLNAHPSGEITYAFKNRSRTKFNLLSRKKRFRGDNGESGNGSGSARGNGRGNGRGRGVGCGGCGGCGGCSQTLMKLAARKTAVRLGVGYVSQDNVVHKILTVHENIAYSAKLRLGSDVTKDTKAKIIQDTITILGLNHIQNVKVGNPLSSKGSISGGETRRVSIGIELVACPGVIILDEPTSGLDAVSANDVMSCLNKMSDLGVTVLASLHQPRYSTFLMFDNVHLFLRGGHVVYTGSTCDVLAYFTALGFRAPEHENPADFMLDVLSGLIERPGDPDFAPIDLAEFWRQHESGEGGKGGGKGGGRHAAMLAPPTKSYAALKLDGESTQPLTPLTPKRRPSQSVANVRGWGGVVMIQQIPLHHHQLCERLDIGHLNLILLGQQVYLPLFEARLHPNLT